MIKILRQIERLITGHGSAKILRERLRLAQDQYVALESKLDDFASEKESLQHEIVGLQEEIANLEGMRTTQADKPAEFPIKTRDDLPKFTAWSELETANYFLTVGQNIRYTATYFDKFAELVNSNQTHFIFIIVKMEDVQLIDVLRRGVLDNQNTVTDFRTTIEGFKKMFSLVEKDKRNLLELRFIDFVPAVSYQVIGRIVRGKGKNRTCQFDDSDPDRYMIVEPQLNRTRVPERMPIQLDPNDPIHSEFFERHWADCMRIYKESTLYPLNGANSKDPFDDLTTAADKLIETLC